GARVLQRGEANATVRLDVRVGAVRQADPEVVASRLRSVRGHDARRTVFEDHEVAGPGLEGDVVIHRAFRAARYETLDGGNRARCRRRYRRAWWFFDKAHDLAADRGVLDRASTAVTHAARVRPAHAKHALGECDRIDVHVLRAVVARESLERLRRSENDVAVGVKDTGAGRVDGDPQALAGLRRLAPIRRTCRGDAQAVHRAARER